MSNSLTGLAGRIAKANEVTLYKYVQLLLGIPQYFSSVLYTRIDQAISHINQIGPGCVLSKLISNLYSELFPVPITNISTRYKLRNNFPYFEPFIFSWLATFQHINIHAPLTS